MNYKRMWLSLKKIVREECDVFSWLDPENGEYFKGQAEEAEYIFDEMKVLEVRETLLEEKERAEKDENH